MNIDLDKFQFFADAARTARDNADSYSGIVEELQASLSKAERELDARKDAQVAANAALDAYLRECGYIRMMPPVEAKPFTIVDVPTPDPNAIQLDGLPWEFRCNTVWGSSSTHPLNSSPLWHWWIKGVKVEVSHSRLTDIHPDGRPHYAKGVKEGSFVLCDSTGRALPKEPKVREFWTAADEPNGYHRWHTVGDKAYMMSRGGDWENMTGYLISVTNEVRDGKRHLSTPAGVPLYTDPSTPEARKIIAETLGETP